MSVTSSRQLCSKAVDVPVFDDPQMEKEYREAEYKLNRSIFGRFWDWLMSPLEEPPVSFSNSISKYVTLSSLVMLRSNYWWCLLSL